MKSCRAEELAFQVPGDSVNRYETNGDSLFLDYPS